MAFLIGFISKDKQTEAMTEKLCLRFCTSDEVQHHRDVAFCVGTLQHTERSVKKLHELFKTFADKLGDAEVRESFAALARGARKFAKAELKTALSMFAKARELAHRHGRAPAELICALGKSLVKLNGKAESIFGHPDFYPSVLFRALDEDGDGKIMADEIEAFLKQCGINLPNTQINKAAS